MGADKLKTEIKNVEPEDSVGIPRPTNKFSMDQFRVSEDGVKSVGTLIHALPCYKISDAGDFVRLHPDEENYWSCPFYLVEVPIKGQKKKSKTHLVTEAIADAYLGRSKVKRVRLALASKPFDNFFLCIVPAQNEDNSFNESALRWCEVAKAKWVEVYREENKDAYAGRFPIDADAFDEPNWPTQPLEDLIGATFDGCLIIDSEHEGLKRLRGQKQSL